MSRPRLAAFAALVLCVGLSSGAREAAAGGNDADLSLSLFHSPNPVGPGTALTATLANAYSARAVTSFWISLVPS